MKLVKRLYELKQAGRLWNKLLDKTLADIGYKQSLTDSCVYFKTSSEGTAIVVTYVDDLLTTATNESLPDDFGDAMKSLELKRLGAAEHFLGMRIRYSEDAGYAIYQEQPIVEILQNMECNQLKQCVRRLWTSRRVEAHVR